jgi:hypothetical protein
MSLFSLIRCSATHEVCSFDCRTMESSPPGVKNRNRCALNSPPGMSSQVIRHSSVTTRRASRNPILPCAGS